ncbi:hypothetical protein QBC38DRAFT_193640 [Podospora fimiseda]|uniref:Transcription factor tau subunit sfc6 n=1 Tax=Podospora fimiseda TaxID=252190 RepID=A0AAN7BQ64_9PEZI|nr:hypothetical protein QBC38DRAFT_193640 [Podospora fimiseda]
MPPRRATRGIQKRYVEDPLIFDDEDEVIAVSERKEKDADFDAQQGPGEEEEDDDDNEDGVVAAPTSDEDADDGVGNKKSGGAKAVPAKPKKQRNTGAGMIQSRKGFHDIPHYPLETRIVTRVYAGPLRRYARYSALRDAMYGPEYHRIKIIWDLEIRWAHYPVLPPRLPPEDPSGIMPSPWVPKTNEIDQARKATIWYDQYQLDDPQQRRHEIEDGPDLVPHANGGLVTLVGPYNKQKEYMLGQGTRLSISPSGLPVDDEDATDKTPTGWMFDVQGIPLAVSWAPLDDRTKQVLAIATIPFTDQESNPSGQVNMNKTTMTTGSVQLWEFYAQDTEEGLARPSTKPPRFLGAKCFDWGRPKRLQYCPVPMNAVNLYDTYGMLAVLCSDGRVRILDTNTFYDGYQDPVYEWIDSPVVTFGLSNDYNVEITCLTWVNTNRIAFGHTDGSISLWSVYPQVLLQRHGVHTTYVIDIYSAYPSSPSLVASIPVGGCATLTDLYQPSSEFTYFPVPAISFQPNLLCWNESMQGFMALYPSSTPNTTIAFLHHRFFCQARSICTGPNTLTCVSAGSTHPFILVGCADGSVFSCNALQKLFKQKGEPLRKIKVFEHEYRPLEYGPEGNDVMSDGHRPRGAVRILQGFIPEVNDDPRTEKRKEMDRKKRLERKYSGKKRGRPRKNANPENPVEEEEDREGELEERLASRVVTHEPLTRVTAVAWNPNTHFSCWAACAMGSGLIKIMDLGVE